MAGGPKIHTGNEASGTDATLLGMAASAEKDNPFFVASASLRHHDIKCFGFGLLPVFFIFSPPLFPTRPCLSLSFRSNTYTYN